MYSSFLGQYVKFFPPSRIMKWIRWNISFCFSFHWSLIVGFCASSHHIYSKLTSTKLFTIFFSFRVNYWTCSELTTVLRKIQELFFSFCCCFFTRLMETSVQHTRMIHAISKQGHFLSTYETLAFDWINDTYYTCCQPQEVGWGNNLENIFQKQLLNSTGWSSGTQKQKQMEQ